MNPPQITYRQAHSIMAMSSTTCAAAITKEAIATKWKIGLDAAKQMIQVTTQKGICNAIHPVLQQYRTKQAQLHYNQLGMKHGQFYLDTLFSKVRSVRGNTMGHLYTNDVKCMRFFPIQAKSQVGDTLLEFVQEIGVPCTLHTDDAKEANLGKWGKLRSDLCIPQTQSEPYSPWQNRAEAGIGELNKKTMQFKSATRTLARLWDYCAQYAAEIISLTASDLYTLHGRTPLEMVTGQTPDISEYLDFSWYEPLWHYEEAGFPDERCIIGRWLGVAHRVGQALCYWILSESGAIIACTTVQKVTPDEQSSLLVQERIREFDERVRTKLGHAMEMTDDVHPMRNTYLQDVDDGIFDPIEPEAEMPEANEFDADTYDKYLSAQVLLPKGDLMLSGQVIRRSVIRMGILLVALTLTLF